MMDNSILNIMKTSTDNELLTACYLALDSRLSKRKKFVNVKRFYDMSQMNNFLEGIDSSDVIDVQIVSIANSTMSSKDSVQAYVVYKKLI